MRSSVQRASANIGRRAQTTNGAGFQPGREYDDTARDTALNTELNKVNSECDRYKTRLEQVSKKLLETQQQKDDFKQQRDDFRQQRDDFKQQRDDFKQQRDLFKSRLQVAKDENASAVAELQDYKSANLELAARHEKMLRQLRDLEERYKAPAPMGGAGSAGSAGTHAASSALPDRTRPTYRSGGPDHHEDRGYKGRSRDESRESRETKESKESREYNQYMEFQAAEKERLKGRFGDKSSTTSSSIQARRQSFIEGWGPGPGLEQPVAPPNRIPPTQVPAMPPAFNNMAYSTVPRTRAHMYNPSTAALYGADGEYEGGCKYTPYPLAQD